MSAPPFGPAAALLAPLVALAVAGRRSSCRSRGRGCSVGPTAAVRDALRAALPAAAPPLRPSRASSLVRLPVRWLTAGLVATIVYGGAAIAAARRHLERQPALRALERDPGRRRDRRGGADAALRRRARRWPTGRGRTRLGVARVLARGARARAARSRSRSRRARSRAPGPAFVGPALDAGRGGCSTSTATATRARSAGATATIATPTFTRARSTSRATASTPTATARTRRGAAAAGAHGRAAGGGAAPISTCCSSRSTRCAPTTSAATATRARRRRRSTRWPRTGALFENGWAHAPSTRYSMPAIAAGRWPSAIAWDESIWWPRLGPDVRTTARGAARRRLLHRRAVQLQLLRARAITGASSAAWTSTAPIAPALHVAVNGPMESRGLVVARDHRRRDRVRRRAPGPQVLPLGALLRSAPLVRDARRGAVVRDVARRSLRRRDPLHRPAPRAPDRAPAGRGPLGSHGDRPHRRSRRGLRRARRHRARLRPLPGADARCRSSCACRGWRPGGCASRSVTSTSRRRWSTSARGAGGAGVHRALAGARRRGAARAATPTTRAVFQEVTSERGKKRALVTTTRHLIWNAVPGDTTECYDRTRDPGRGARHLGGARRDDAPASRLGPRAQAPGRGARAARAARPTSWRGR